MIKLLTVAAGLLASTYAEKVTYNNNVVLRCVPKTQEQLELLHALEEGNDMDLDVWQEARRTNRPVDIMVSNNRRSKLETLLSSAGISCNVMVADVQKVIEEEALKHVNLKDASFFDSYHDWNSVYDYIDTLASTFPNYATVSSIGNTYLGKPIKIIKMSTNAAAKKPTLWFDGGLHAREWIAVATVTYIADYLLNGYGKESNATYLLDNYDVIVAPILNVDGYDYTWTTDRMWRKTRSPNAKSPCVGTDPNRNWEFHWGEAGASEQACSDSYQGPSAASEVEVQAIQKYLYDNRDVLKGYINFHSYGQMWMSNWGYTYAKPVDFEDQNGLSAAAAAAIKGVHGLNYEYGTIASTVYVASGSSADYTYGVCGIKYSYGVELRDTGDYGFLLPPSQIVPSGEETWAAIVAMGQYIQAHP